MLKLSYKIVEQLFYTYTMFSGIRQMSQVHVDKPPIQAYPHSLLYYLSKSQGMVYDELVLYYKQINHVFTKKMS